MNKYEQLIEHIINDEEGQARALFHEIVVEKSRDIYESLMDEEYAEEDIGGSPVEAMMDEITMDETDGIGEGEGDDEEMDMEPEMDMDDMEPEMDMDDDEDLEAKVMDLESELEALKAEFESLMGNQEADMDNMDMDMDMDDMEPEMDDMEDDDKMMEKNHNMMEKDHDMMEKNHDMMDEEDEMSESFNESTQRQPLRKTAVDLMREYVEKITDNKGPLVGSGAGGDHANVNDSSVVAGKNDMGGTSQNIAKGGSNNAPDGTSAPKKGTVKDVKDANNWENKPGAKAGNAFSNKPKAKSGEESGINKSSIESGGN
jgi:hypothetical protein